MSVNCLKFNGKLTEDISHSRIFYFCFGVFSGTFLGSKRQQIVRENAKSQLFKWQYKVLSRAGSAGLKLKTKASLTDTKFKKTSPRFLDKGYSLWTLAKQKWSYLM